MKKHTALFMPLAEAFALRAAHTIRAGQKLPGMSYADRELSEAIDRAAARKNSALGPRPSALAS
jgi:hypothetical protein